MELLDLIAEIEISGVPLSQWLIFSLMIFTIVTIIYLVKNKLQGHKNKEMYEKAKDYLKKAEEYNRSPLPLVAVLTLATLVFVEAVGFSYIFSEYILPDASGSAYDLTAIIGGIVIAIILVGLTHITGEHLYYNSLVNKAKSYIQLDLDEDKSRYSFGELNRDIEVENTYDDNEKSNSLQFVSRIQFDLKNKNIVKKYAIPFFTLILVIIIAVTAYIVRDQTYEQLAIEERIEAKQETVSQTNKENSHMSDYLRDSLIESEEIHHLGKIMAKEKSNDTTYFLLSVLFIAIQVLGIYTGLKWGFQGRHSKEAYKIKKGYLHEKL